jgi:hypothetical protein
VLIKRSVKLVALNVAISEGALGTVLGIQLAAVFQSPVEGLLLHVALPAKHCRGAARYSTAAVTTKLNVFIDMLIDIPDG